MFCSGQTFMWMQFDTHTVADQVETLMATALPDGSEHHSKTMCTASPQKLINGPRKTSDSWRPHCRLDWALTCRGMVEGPLGGGPVLLGISTLKANLWVLWIAMWGLHGMDFFLYVPQMLEIWGLWRPSWSSALCHVPWAIPVQCLKGGGYCPSGNATAIRKCRCREGDVPDSQLCLDWWEEYNKKVKAFKFPKSKPNQAPIRGARRSPSHWGLTSQLIGLKSSAANALVLVTTGQPQRSCVHATTGQRQVQSAVGSPLIGHVPAQLNLIGI